MANLDQLMTRSQIHLILIIWLFAAGIPPAHADLIDQAWSAYRAHRYPEAEKLYFKVLQGAKGKHDEAKEQTIDRLAALYYAMDVTPDQIVKRTDLLDAWEKKQLFTDLIKRYGRYHPRSRYIRVLLGMPEPKKLKLDPVEPSFKITEDKKRSEEQNQSQDSFQKPVTVSFLISDYDKMTGFHYLGATVRNNCGKFYESVRITFAFSLANRSEKKEKIAIVKALRPYQSKRLKELVGKDEIIDVRIIKIEPFERRF